MLNLSDYQKDKIYGLSSNGALIPFDSMEDAKIPNSVKYILEVKYKNNYGPTSFGNYDISYDVAIFNRDGIKTTIMVNGIELIKILYLTTTASNPFYDYGYSVTIADKKGNVKTVGNLYTGKTRDYGLEWVFKIMEELAIFDDWDAFEFDLKRRKEESQK